MLTKILSELTYYAGTSDKINENAPKETTYADYKNMAKESRTITVRINVADVTGTKITLGK